MKKRLLSLLASALVTAGAMAQWTAPGVKYTTQLSDIGVSNYTGVFYHVGQDGYLTAGTTWNTHAALTKDLTSALVWDFTNTGSNMWEFYCPTLNKHTSILFRTVDPDVYCDHTSGNEATDGMYWELVEQEGGGFRIRSSAKDPVFGANRWLTDQTSDSFTYYDDDGNLQYYNMYDQSQYVMAWDPTNTDVNSSGSSLGTNVGIFMVAPELVTDEEDSYQGLWYVVSGDDYNLYKAQGNLCDALNSALAMGFEESALSAYAVYLESDDIDAVNEALDAVNTMISNSAFAFGSKDNPIDITDDYLVNADFSQTGDELTTDIYGWVNVDGSMYYRKHANTPLYIPGEGASTDFNAFNTTDGWCENWTGVAETLPAANLYQVIPDLPEGFYYLSAYCLSQTRTTEEITTGASLYAISNGATFSVAVHDSVAYGTTLNNYPMEYTVEVTHLGGELTVGFRFDPGFSTWLGVSYFHLKYAGEVEDPGISILPVKIEAAQGYLDGLNNGTYYYSDALKNQLSTEITKAEDILAGGDEDACYQEVQTLGALISQVQAEITMYEKLYTLFNQVLSDMEVYKTSLPDLYNTLEEMEQDYEDAYYDMDAESEKVDAWVEAYETFVSDYVKQVMASATADNPIEISSLAKNMTFTGDSFDGWDFSSATGNGTVAEACAEVWNSTFTCLQTLTDMPAGLYKLSTKSFYRTAGYATDYSDYQAGTGEVLTMLQVADATAPVIDLAAGAQEGTTAPTDGYVSIGEDDAGPWVANTMASAAYAFDTDDTYACEVEGYLVNNGDLTFGIRNDGPVATDAWSIWNEMHLTYYGQSNSVLYDMLQEKIAEAAALCDEIVVVEATHTALLSAAATAENYTSSNTVAELTEAIDALQSSIDEANVSLELLNELKSLFEYYSEMSVVESTEPSLPTLLETISVALANEDGVKDDAQMKEWIETLPTAWVVYVQYDCLTSASKDVPADITAAIINPSFDTGQNNTEGAFGWTFDYTTSGGHIGWSSTAQQENSNYAFEFWQMSSFKMDQTIKGLAQGYYHLTANAAYRGGNNEASVAAVYFNFPDQARDVALFANTVSMQVTCVYDGKQEESDTYGTGASCVYDGVTYYLPNTMADAYAYFDGGLYLNELDVYLAEGDDLDVGLALNGNVVSYNWCVFDNFTLAYLGDGDENMPEAIESVEESEEGSSVVAIYDLAGRKVAKVQRGIYIVNGKKVLVK